MSQQQWTIKGRQLKVTDTFSYLGAVLGNGGSAEHVNQRIRAAKNAPRSLQAAGLHANWLDPLAAMHVYSIGVQPCLNYGAHTTDLSTTELRALDTTHSNLIKGRWGCLSFVDQPPFYELLSYKEYSYLGIEIDNRLYWKQQIAHKNKHKSICTLNMVRIIFYWRHNNTNKKSDIHRTGPPHIGVWMQHMGPPLDELNTVTRERSE